MKGRLAVLGAGGHGRVVADAAAEAGWGDIVFFDDRFPLTSSTLDWPVVGTIKDCFSALARFDGVIVAIGNGRARLRVLSSISEISGNAVSIIHPRAWVSSRCSLGEGTMVAAGAVVNAGAQIGRGAIINTGATVDHDCMIAPGVHIAPGSHVSGGVEIGMCSWIGVGTSVRQGITIGSDVVVGAGAAVVCDLPDGALAVGVPARFKG